MCNPRTWEAEAGRFRVQDQSELYRKTYSIHTGLVGVVVIVNLVTVQPKNTEMTEALSVRKDLRKEVSNSRRLVFARSVTQLLMPYS